MCFNQCVTTSHIHQNKGLEVLPRVFGGVFDKQFRQMCSTIKAPVPAAT